jgi:5-oxoprolinase (ATP-hydrolysing) subunit C
MALTVLAPGLFSLPVGLPRPGRRALGVPPGGAADVASLMLGNALVGNPPDAVGLEVTLAGPTLRADADTGGVVFGAPFEITRDGQPVEANHTFTLRAGEVLKVGGTPTGCRAYLCVPGGFTLPPVPAPLAAGDVLACAESRVRGRSIRWESFDDRTRTPPTRRVAPLPGDLPHKGGGVQPTSPLVGEDGTRSVPGGGECVLRVLPGPQHDWFADDSFFTRTWNVGEASNRMGVRLAGEPIRKRAGELVSEPVAAGAVQVTHDGRPIILGVDGQTIGGYPKVAHVVRADLDRVGQLRPGAAVRFVCVNADEAEVLNRAKWAELSKWFVRLSVAGVGEFKKI